MKRIVCTVTTDLNYDQRMQRICNSLVDDGYRVMLVGRTQNISKPLISRKFKQKRFPMFFQTGKWMYMEYNIRLFFFLLFHKSDAICSVDLDSILPGYIIAKLKSWRFVYDAHEYFTELPTVVNKPVVSRIWKGIERWIVPKTKFAYTVCESIATFLNDEYKVDFKVIRNVPLAGGYQVEKDHEGYLLYQGVVKKGRELHWLVDCMEFIDAKLQIAGDGELKEELLKYVQEKGLEQKIQFLGYVDPNQLKSITTKAWIGVNPLQNLGKSYYYSLTNKFFDYIQAGVPQISMNYPEYAKINDSFQIGEMINEKDSNAFIKAVQKFRDANYYRNIKDNCNEAAKKLCWEKEEIVLKEFWKEVFK